MQPAFTVEVLALEAQVLRHLPLRHAEFAFGFAPGAELPAPDGLAVRIRHPFRQAVEFGVAPVNLAVIENAVDARQRLVASLGVKVLNVVVRLAVALFTGELQALPVEAFSNFASPSRTAL
ncbi:hypothetical protein QMS67_21745 [Cronobacter turicensis]|nr:hypothetical protein [Cronobacter turicensis]MDK1337430.1 hypothetical protein [Cronobacter turicensis]